MTPAYSRPVGSLCICVVHCDPLFQQPAADGMAGHVKGFLACVSVLSLTENTVKQAECFLAACSHPLL